MKKSCVKNYKDICKHTLGEDYRLQLTGNLLFFFEICYNSVRNRDGRKYYGKSGKST